MNESLGENKWFVFFLWYKMKRIRLGTVFTGTGISLRHKQIIFLHSSLSICKIGLITTHFPGFVLSLK